MRTCLCAAALIFLTAATATAQLIRDKPVDRPAAEAKKGAGAPAADEEEQGPAQPNAMFAAIDADGDGVITKKELRKAIAALNTLDADGDGSITLVEASAGVTTPAAGGDSAQLVNQMLQHDKNRDGKLTADEIPQQFLPMLQNADRNGDGALDRTELAGVAQNMNGWQAGQNWGGNTRGGPSANAMGRFLQYDQNGDGALSANEVPANMRSMLNDANGDGLVDAGELRATIARMGGRASGVGADPNGKRTPARDLEERARKREQKP